jgi:prepilin-type N-terminal cleavage/methylation domain-containing protein/prepilin-type processing-associated H-X9-DG protein
LKFSQKRSQSAFTLIELLVVIAIISILAAILFPVFAKAREKARQTSCLSNNKQYSLAAMMYLQDYDETFPLSAYLNVFCVETFYSVVNPYVKNDQVTRCPSDPDAIEIAALVGAPCANTPKYTGYVVNHALFVNGFFPDPSPVALAQVNVPAGTIMLYDGNVTSGAAPGQQIQLVQARHVETFNAAYVDGHVKSVHATKTGTANQFTVMGPGPLLDVFTIGKSGGFYEGLTECLGIPQ